jgi:hypothetical protein
MQSFGGCQMTSWLIGVDLPAGIKVPFFVTR